MKKITMIFVVIMTTLSVAYAYYTVNKATFPILVDGKEFVSENDPLVVNGRTYLALRDTGKALNTSVKWNEEKGQVEIGKTKQKKYNIGDTAEINNINITLNKIRVVEPTKYNKPEDGNKFIAVDISVTNNRAEDLAFLFVKVMDENNYKYDRFFASSLNVKGEVNGTIPAGLTERGEFLYEVPLRCNNPKILVTPFTDDTIIFDAEIK